MQNAALAGIGEPQLGHLAWRCVGFSIISRSLDSSPVE
jgi:hypothetical protein